jgi:DNA-binding response OmpR family regulator
MKRTHAESEVDEPNGFNPVLAVDTDTTVCARECSAWNKRGIDVVRVDSMCDALCEADRNIFLFVAINADNIDYMAMLSALKDAAEAPVFIFTSNFNIHDQVEALHNGADVYAPFHRSEEDNIMSTLALLRRYEERGQPFNRQSKVISHRKLQIMPKIRQVFCDEKELPLTKTEFDTLHYLLVNRGISISFEQIYRNVWGTGYGDTAHSILWNHVAKLRKKIARITGEDGYIENVRDIGYRLPKYDDL